MNGGLLTGGGVSSATFAFVRDLVRARTGIALDDDKTYLVETRLAPIARSRGQTSVDDLVAALAQGTVVGLEDQVIDAMTTNETSWLRDVEPFQVLVREIVPAILAARSPDDPLVVWSAACSTGQEAYSVAMLLEDMLGARGIPFAVVATDISRTVLAQAEAGSYGQLEINRGLPAPYLVRHFERVGTGWQVRPELRARVRFLRHNLVHDAPPVPRADVVLCRNVLIYFDLPTRRQVLAKVRRVLPPDGALLLGAAESTLGLAAGWTRSVHGRTTVSRPDPSVPDTELESGPRLASPVTGRG